MKVLFWFQGWPTYLPHAIALTLKRRYGVSNFSAIVLGRRCYNFLKKQNQVKYDPLVLVQNIFLKSQKLKIDYKYISFIEKKYGIPTLWQYLCADKDFLKYNRFTSYSHEDLQRIVQGYFKFTIELLEKAKPDFIVMQLAESMELLILHEVARHMKIPTLILTVPRVGDRATIFSNTYDGAKIPAIYDKLLKEDYKSPYEKEAVDFIKKFRAEGTAYTEFLRSYAGQQELYKSILKSPVKSLIRALRYFYHYHAGDFKDDYMYKNKSMTRLAQAEMEVRVRRAFLKKSRIFEKPNYKEQYIFSPLHYEPEIATLLLAPFYIDQIALVENVARSLPMTFKLYVKEAPTMVGFRPISDYQRLLKMPNIRLIDPSIRSFELIKNARIVITITGTAGLEALLLKKPVITFGRVFYNKLDMVRKAKSITSLPELIRDTLENYNHDEEQLVKFITAVFEGSFSAMHCDVAAQESVEKTIAHPYFNAILNALAEEMHLKPLAPQRK